MPFYEKGDVRIHYEEAGAGFPLLVMPGGGLNSRISNWATAPFNAMEEFQNEFRCITMDQRNANGGASSGPVQVDAPWGAFADDQLGLMDHVTMAIVDAYLHALYRSPGDFVYSVTRDFVRTCQTPMLVMPDDNPAHPYAVAMEIVHLAPHAEVTVYPWKAPKDRLAQTVRHVRDFLRAHHLVTAAR